MPDEINSQEQQSWEQLKKNPICRYAVPEYVAIVAAYFTCDFTIVGLSAGGVISNDSAAACVLPSIFIMGALIVGETYSLFKTKNPIVRNLYLLWNRQSSGEDRPLLDLTSTANNNTSGNRNFARPTRTDYESGLFVNQRSLEEGQSSGTNSNDRTDYQSTL